MNLAAEVLAGLDRRARLDALRADPASLFRRVGKEPDDWQADLLRRWDEPEEVFVCGSRQIGKSWGVAALIALESLLCPGTLTMITGPGERQAKELYAKVTGFIVDGCGLGNELDGPPGATSTLWRNGSLIRWAPGNSGTIRGFSPKLWERSPRVRLVVEEASITEDAVANAIRPMMLAANGRFVALGTAFGQRGFFWDTFERKPGGVRRYTLPVTDFPRLMTKTVPDGRLWVDAGRERIGDFWFDQEYLCKFHAPIGSLYSPEHIQAAIDDETPPLWPTSEWVSQPAETMAVDASSLF